MKGNLEAEQADAAQSLTEGWGATLQSVLCTRCSWVYLAPASESLERCPHCQAAALTSVEEVESSARAAQSHQLSMSEQTAAPELVAPFNISNQTLESAIERFSAGIPFAGRGVKRSSPAHAAEADHAAGLVGGCRSESELES